MSNKLTDLFGQLKTSIVGTKTAKIDSILDKAVGDIINYKANSGRNGYIDLVKTVIAKSSTDVSSLGNNNLLLCLNLDIFFQRLLWNNSR